MREKIQESKSMLCCQRSCEAKEGMHKGYVLPPIADVVDVVNELARDESCELLHADNSPQRMKQ